MEETYVKINLDNLSNNVKNIINKYNDYDYYIGVVKGDAYGHGEYIINTLLDSGINYFAVSTLEEALDIRKFNKDVRVLILEPVSLNNIDIAIKNNFTITVHYLDYIKELNNIIKDKIKCHIKIDSGMGRLGIKDKKELKESYEILKNNKNIEVEGIYTHFATIGVFDKKWDNQLYKFKEITSLINLKDIPIIHLGSSIVLLSHPKIEFANAIRIGTLLYGYNITPTESNVGLKNKLRLFRNKYYQKKYDISKTYTNVKLELFPCMSFYTSILQINKLNKGEQIGYGAKVTLEDDSYVAIIPVGYNNGIGTKNINRFVFINNKKYKVLSVGMNMSFVLVDSSVKVTDEVVILDGKNITIGTLARFNDTTFHEMLINIGKSNKRKYYKNEILEYEEE